MSGAGPKALALDEVCAFARLVTRVPALVVDGKTARVSRRAPSLGRTAIFPAVDRGGDLCGGGCREIVEMRAAGAGPRDGSKRFASCSGPRRRPALAHDGPGRAAERPDASAELRHVGRRRRRQCPRQRGLRFPTSEDMESALVTWDSTGAMRKILQKKLVTCAVGDESETSKALEVFCRCADRGRGCVFFCAASSAALSCAIGCARTVIFAGVPLEPMSEAVRARLDRALCDLQLRESDHLAARAA